MFDVKRRVDHRTVAIFIGIALLTVGVALLLTTFTPLVAAGLILALILCVVSFLSPDLALYILIFAMLLSPEVTVGATGGTSLGRGVTLRLDDFLLVVIGLSWLARSAVQKEVGLIAKTPINRQIFVYIMVTFVATVAGIMFGRVEPKTGLLFVLKYFEYFFVYFMVVNHVREPRQVKHFVGALLITCGHSLCHGNRPDSRRRAGKRPVRRQGGRAQYLRWIPVVADGLRHRLPPDCPLL